MQWILDHQLLIFVAFTIAGFVVVGMYLFEIQKMIRRLLGGKKGGVTGDLKDNFAERITKTEIRLDDMEPRLMVSEFLAHTSMQKFGFIRFNPFENTGGDNSFILVLLNQENNGIVLSSLYMREGARMYAKHITRGTSKQPMSDEEKKLLEETMKQEVPET